MALRMAVPARLATSKRDLRISSYEMLQDDIVNECKVRLVEMVLSGTLCANVSGVSSSSEIAIAARMAFRWIFQVLG